MEEETSTASQLNVKPIVAVLLSGAFVAILNQTLLVTALPRIMGDLEVDATRAQWLTTVFMLVNGIMIPITAFLIEKFTTRRLYITAMGLFVSGTLLAAISPNFSMLLAARVVQAMGAGIMLPLMQTIFLYIFPIHKRGAAMGLVGLVISFAPAIGPTLSGLIVDSYSWRILFYIIFPIALINMIISIFVLKNVSEVKKRKVDVMSIMLSSLGFGGLLYGFSTAGSDGWGSQVVLLSISIGLVSLFFFIVRQLKLETPVLEFRVFKNPIFALTTVVSMIVFLSMIGVETLLPLYIQDARGYSALHSGMLLLPGALVMGMMSPIAGRIFDKFGARRLALTGLSLLTVSTMPFVFFDDSTSLTWITMMYALRMLGISMVMMPVNTAGLNQLPRHLLAHGAAMSNTMRQVAASMGTAILITVMSNAATRSSAAMPDEAMIDGMQVAFLVSAIIALLGLVLSIFIKNTRPQHPV